MGKFVALYNESECENPRSSLASISLSSHFFLKGYWTPSMREIRHWTQLPIIQIPRELHIPIWALVKTYGIALTPFSTLFWTRIQDEAKYGCEFLGGGGGWCSNSMYASCRMSLWKYISWGWLMLSRYLLWQHLQYDIRDGSRVKFWQAWWCGDNSLHMCFPKLFI